MNHIYRIVWNHATSCFQAVTESAKGVGKGANKVAATVQNSSELTLINYLSNQLKTIVKACCLVCLGVSAVSAQTTVTVSNTVDRGWYRADGYHDTTNTNTFVGNYQGDGLIYHNFHVYQLPTLTADQVFVSGNISFNRAEVLNPNGNVSVPFVIYGFNGNTTTLQAGTGGLAAYNGLRSGLSYGTTEGLGANYSIMTTNLNDAGLAGLTQSQGANFIIGGELPTASVSNRVSIFGYSGFALAPLNLNYIKRGVGTYYWDTDGAKAGAGSATSGASPNGTWGLTNSDRNWNDKATGVGATSAWINGSDANFAAGTDATGNFTVTQSNNVGVRSVNYSSPQAGSKLTIAAGTGSQIALTGDSAAGGSTSFNVGNGNTLDIQTALVNATPAGPAGIVNKVNAGNLTLSAANTYTGATTIAGGTLALAGSGSIASSSGVNLSAAGAKFDVSGLTSKATTIQDFSGVAGTTVNTGATVLTVGSANSTTFASEITGSGGLNKVGSGTLEITGNSAAFTGQNTVSAGHLKVNGYLGGSSLDVGSGSLLSGSGTVGGQTTIKAGGTISPGNSIGTLNVAGSFTQEGGSTYQVEVDPKSTSSDRIAVSGSANLGGAQLSVTKTSGEAYILDTKYTVLTAAGGVNGKYTIAGDTAVSAFYNLQDQYDANNVYLKVAQTTSFQKAGETFNQIATGAAVQSTPTGSKLHNLVGNMQDFATARAAFDQMSGEIYASMAGARLSDATEILQTATNRSRNAFCADASPQTTDTVQTCQVNPDKAVRWAQVVGSRATTNTDGNAAALARNSAGLVVGADMKVGDATRAGVLFNAKNTSYSVNDRLSSAKQQDVGVGIYASGKAVEAVNIDYRAGATYTHHDVTANRRVNFKGLNESFKSNFKASTVQVFGEIGRLIAVSSNATIEPFANVVFVRNDQKAFKEQAVGESKDLSALHAGKSSQDVAYTTLGMRGAVDYTVGTAKLSLRGLVGLRHTISKNIPLSRHQFSQSDEFTVAGVPVAKNLAVAEIGVGYDVNKQISVGVSYNGQYASGSKNHGIKVTFEYKF